MGNVTNVHEWITSYYNFSAAFSIIFNSILIYLILKKSPQNFGVYRFLMAFISVFEIIYSILDLYLTPIHYSYLQATIVMIKTTGRSFPPQFYLYLDAIYFGFFGASLALFAIHFIYRYLVVANSPILSSFNSWRIIYWFSFPLSISMIWILSGFFLCASSKEIDDYIRDDLFQSYGEQPEDVVYLGILMYYYTSQSQLVIGYQNFVSLGLMTLTISFSFFLIVIFGYKCYQRIKHLHSFSNNSSHTLNIQLQLFFALAIQTSIPVFLMHTPAVLMFGLGIFGNGMGKYCGIMSITISLYPLMDPLPNFFIISPYRKAILDCLKRKLATVTVDSIHPVTSIQLT